MKTEKKNVDRGRTIKYHLNHSLDIVLTAAEADAIYEKAREAPEVPKENLFPEDLPLMEQ